ncbi:hypothetical protein [Legionella impletisoli]|uniref:Uncharacterized protein n=1 Tax=Legionella impletisoli TaxID=343510 RepID=A0A917JSZ9_9GAMM|nr:hypothetical protein [Legionella impletisoli]GGI82362.1 hypothetical protein GCM10007966_08660 [Legionella impletisoli]
MNRTKEGSDTEICVKLGYKKHKQKLLIQALLTHCEINFEIMAQLVGVSLQKLLDVYRGKDYFKADKATRLVQLFLIRFADDISFL